MAQDANGVILSVAFSIFNLLSSILVFLKLHHPSPAPMPEGRQVQLRIRQVAPERQHRVQARIVKEQDRRALEFDRGELLHEGGLELDVLGPVNEEEFAAREQLPIFLERGG